MKIENAGQHYSADEKSTFTNIYGIHENFAGNRVHAAEHKKNYGTAVYGPA